MRRGIALIESTIIRKVECKDCTPDLLLKFNRYQVVSRYWRKEDAKWVLRDISYTETWDENKKLMIVNSFLRCLKGGGRVVGAFNEDGIIGFASVDAALFGSQNQYVNLDLLHISYEHRSRGIGKRLFSEICVQAKELQAKKLYISAHSAEEPMAFYRKMGCVDAVEINQAIAQIEPSDCQLEYVL